MEYPVLMPLPPPSARLIVPRADGMSGSAEAQEVKTGSRLRRSDTSDPAMRIFRAAFTSRSCDSPQFAQSNRPTESVLYHWVCAGSVRVP
jgi:hypothetical protein